MAYIKYSYWLDNPESIVRDLEKQGADVFTVRKAVCIPLSPRVEIGLIPPDAWKEYKFCRRQYSWYFQSPFAGKTLLVSSIDLAGMGIQPETIIREGNGCTITALPEEKDLPEMLANPDYIRAEPAGWKEVDRAEFEQWLRIMRIDGITSEGLFRWHRANHANFFDPKYFLTDNGQTVPYSLGPSRRVCSACLEFFNIIGRKHHRKLVVPCPGAVGFGGLKKDVWYEVISSYK